MLDGAGRASNNLERRSRVLSGIGLEAYDLDLEFEELQEEMMKSSGLLLVATVIIIVSRRSRLSSLAVASGLWKLSRLRMRGFTRLTEGSSTARCPRLAGLEGQQLLRVELGI